MSVFIQACLLFLGPMVRAQGTNQTEQSTSFNATNQSSTEPAVSDALLDPSEDLCSTVNGSPEAFSVSWHIAGVFIVLGVSALGIVSSLLLGSIYQSQKKPLLLERLLQLSKMFGIGVIAGTAWIHLLPEAFASFENPCLDSWWAFYGNKWVGVFGLTAAFMVQLIELAGHSHMRKGANHDSVTAISNMCDAHVPMGLDQNRQLIHRDREDGMTLGRPEQDSQNNAISVTSNIGADSVAVLKFVPFDNADSKIFQNTKCISTIILEMGILIHSLIIGLALGVASDSNFDTLLIAISFHQLFEGMALGSLIGDANHSIFSKVMMGLLYPISTPIGIGIGIAVHSIYSENQPNLILIQGILGSLSSGILIYSTYCELVGNEINHNPIFERFPRTFKYSCFFSMYLGATAMALIGIWA